MRLTYRKTILLTLGRAETKVWRASPAYQDELQRTMKDLANDRGMPVELYLSSWQSEAHTQLHVDTVVPSIYEDKDPMGAVS